MLSIIILVGIVVYCLVLLFVVSSAFWAFVVTRVPFVPTPSKDIKTLTDYLKLTSSDQVMDIGSGDGRVVFLFEKNTPAKVRGVELGSWMYITSHIKRKLNKSRAEFWRKNFFKISWQDATVLYCYLYPPLMKSVGEKAKEEMRSGSIVVSRDFPIPNLELIHSIKLDVKHDFYIYKV